MMKVDICGVKRTEISKKICDEFIGLGIKAVMIRKPFNTPQGHGIITIDFCDDVYDESGHSLKSLCYSLMIPD